MALSISNSFGTITTTGQSTTFDGVITDVSIIPYMRSQLIQFTAEGLRPNRRVYFFFDDTDVSDYIVKTDELTLTENSNVSIFSTGFSNSDIIRIGTGNTHTALQGARLFLSDDDGTNRARKRILKVANSVGRFAIGATVTGSITGNTGTIGSIIVKGGESLNSYFNLSTANSIILPPKTQDVANNYWGTDGSNTIILIPNRRRRGRRVRASITGFDNVTRTLYLSSSNTPANLVSVYPDSDLAQDNTSNQVAWTIGTSHTTDFEGKYSGTFVVPPAFFRTGERVFRIIDDVNNDPADCTTRADYRFVAAGLQVVKNDIVLNSPKIVSLPPKPATTSVRTTRIVNEDKRTDRGDPIAQTFFVDSTSYPNGIFVSSVGLFFYNKDQILPVTVQIRPTVNGYPDSYEIIQYAETTIPAEFVEVSTDASVETRATFDIPIHLSPGEYALVIKSDSLEYEVFVSEVGSKIIGTDRTISKQPYLGSFFKSQNASTWDAIQLEDLTFKLYKAVFATAGTIDMYNESPLGGSASADALYAHIDDKKLPSTNVTYTHSYDSGSTYEAYTPDTTFVPNTGRVTILSSAGGTYRLRAALGTTDTHVSPYLFNNLNKFFALENYIDNGELSNTDFTVYKSGSGYPASANIGLTISDYRGSGYANAYATTNATGAIQSVTVTSPGYGYINAATVVITADNSTTTNASIKISSETDSSGGPAIAKYISRSVTLAEGFDAGDLRVFLTAYKPSGTDIKVYYKVKASDDPDSFASKEYTLMNQKTKSSLYSGLNSFNNKIEYEFEPYDTLNSISYTTSTTTYTSFNQYAIKIVLLSDATTKYPIVYDMRAIALPAMDT